MTRPWTAEDYIAALLVAAIITILATVSTVGLPL